MAFCTARKASRVTLWIAVPLLVLAIACIFVFGAVYDKLLKKQINLADGSLVSDIWKDIPIPIYEKVYFFNVTNEDEFLDGKKLNVVEVGPYVFKAKWVKPHPVWHPNHTVSYREVRTYEFVRDLSNGSEDDFVYTLNAPLVLAAHLAKDSLAAIKFLLYLFLLANKETLITRKSIRELVYEGYEDPIIKDAKYVKTIPYKDGKFSWLHGQNASDDGLFTVFTGEDDASKTNVINNWNGHEKLSFWKAGSCNDISRSTNIETGPPIKDDVESYSFFQSIFCRSLTFDYQRDTRHRDIPAKRFRPSYEVFANSTQNPQNGCFEVNGERASGVLDVSPCQFGAPVFLSFPHFHMADSSYLQLVDGLYPNDSQHGSHLDVEPITGMSIDISVKFQINLKIEKDPVIRQFHQSRDGIYPVFWVELSLMIDEKMADLLKSRVNLPKVVAYVVITAVSVLCLAAIVISCLVLVFAKKPRDECLLAEEKHGYTERKVHSGESYGGHVFENHSISKAPVDISKAPVDISKSPVVTSKSPVDISKPVEVPSASNSLADEEDIFESPRSMENIYPSLQ